MRLRRALAGATALLSLAVLCACTASPEPAPTADPRHITAPEFDGLVLADDLDPATTIDTTFNLEPLRLKAPSILSFWEASDGKPADCLDSYFVSFLLQPNEVQSSPDDEFADIAGYYPGDDGGVNVAARSFESEDAARAFLDTVAPSASACTSAGGYELYQGDGVVGWKVSSVTVTPVALDIDGVTALEQEETIVDDFAARYRVTLLQHDNAIVAVTAQLHSTSTFTFDQVDDLVGLVAGRLAELD